MVYEFITLGIVLHGFFWGAGLAAFVTPARLRRWWWVFAPSCGIALQSLVVWVGAHAGLAGTDVYAWPSELLPLVLLSVAIRQRRLTVNWKGPLPGVLALLFAAGLLLVVPMGLAGSGLQTSSLGSCDHADYAAGARAFAGFSMDESDGFFGQEEVIRTGSADDFFEFWMRLNHFSPAAMLAHHSSIFGVEIHRLVSVFAAALFLMNLPIVWFLARLVTGLRGWRIWAVVSLYALSPLGQYGVHNGALGQLLAVNGLALLLVMAAWTERTGWTWRIAWRSGPLFATAYAVLISGYHFIVVVSLAQAGALLAGMACLRRDGRRALRTLAVLSAGFALGALIYAGRIAAVVERFALFDRYDFGWKIPVLTIEGWLGLVRDAHLGGWPPLWRAALTGGCMVLWTLGLVCLWRRNRRQAITLAALVLPVAAGWMILSRESLVRDNAAYDAYKLLSVFRPGLLAGLCGGLALAAWNIRRAWIGLVMLAVIAGNVAGTADIVRRMSHPSLRTDRYLADLEKLEQRPDFQSVNLTLAHNWDRLWANYFLLGVRQYFPEATYEGRNGTALRGAWSLHRSALRVLPQNDADTVVLNDVYYAVRESTKLRIAVTWGFGWHAVERSGSMAWRWAGARGGINVDNSHKVPVWATLRVRAAVAEPGRRLQIRQDHEVILTEALTTRMKWTDEVRVLLPPGRSKFYFRTVRPALRGVGDDGRLLSVSVSAVEIQRLADPPPPVAGARVAGSKS